MAKKEIENHVQNIHGVASNWIDLYWRTHRGTHGGKGSIQGKIYRVLSVTEAGWATIERQNVPMQKSGQGKVCQVNLETLDCVDGDLNVVEWCQKGYDVESPQGHPSH